MYFYESVCYSDEDLKVCFDSCNPCYDDALMIKNLVDKAEKTIGKTEFNLLTIFGETNLKEGNFDILYEVFPKFKKLYTEKFNPNNFKEPVRGISSLSISDVKISNFDFLKNFPDLKELDIPSDVQNTSLLNKFQNIESLGVGENISILEELELPNLKKLEVYLNENQDISILSKFPKLKELSIVNFEKCHLNRLPKNIESLDIRHSEINQETLFFPKLKALYLDTTFLKININEFLKDVSQTIEHLELEGYLDGSPIKNLKFPKLKTLILQGNLNLKLENTSFPVIEKLKVGYDNFINISDLNSMKTLKHLSIDEIDITGLDLPNLEVFYGGSIKDISYLNLPNLKILKVYGLESGINSINNSPNIEYLSLCSGKFKSFENINLPKLKTLCLSEGKVEKIDVKSLPSLETLDIAFTKIKLENLIFPKLKSLIVGDNVISTVQVFKNLKLPELEFFDGFNTLNTDPIYFENIDAPKMRKHYSELKETNLKYKEKLIFNSFFGVFN
jgi:hypothetical protein